MTVARGAVSNPWILGQVRDLLAESVPLAPTLGEQRFAIELHLRESIAQHGARGAGRARTHANQHAVTHVQAIGTRAQELRSCGVAGGECG